MEVTINISEQLWIASRDGTLEPVCDSIVKVLEDKELLCRNSRMTLADWVDQIGEIEEITRTIRAIERVVGRMIMTEGSRDIVQDTVDKLCSIRESMRSTMRSRK
jgi:hypothetical protein